jgi:hypothetical protein
VTPFFSVLAHINVCSKPKSWLDEQQSLRLLDKSLVRCANSDRRKLSLRFARQIKKMLHEAFATALLNASGEKQQCSETHFHSSLQPNRRRRVYI